VGFQLAIGSPSPSRVPARRPGNFFLLAQKKVTKKEGLNTDLAVPLGYAVRRAAVEPLSPIEPMARCCFGPKRTEYQYQYSQDSVRADCCIGYSVRFGPKHQRQVGSMGHAGERPPAGPRGRSAQIKSVFRPSFLVTYRCLGHLFW
jgi:hypothetical protein